MRDRTQRWRDYCDHLHEVDRIFCAECCSVLATECVRNGSSVADGSTLHLALGAVEDRSIPDAWARLWQVPAESSCETSRSRLWTTLPGKPTSTRLKSQVPWVRGGCACGGCAFVANVFPGELQHCYCGLCRKLSGSVGQTWMPSHAFKWISQATLAFRRTTPRGRRHMCTTCGTVMTIVYDMDSETIWPAAGALDDASLPSCVKSCLAAVVHICCDWMPPWYRLPDDDLPRLRYAGSPVS